MAWATAAFFDANPVDASQRRFMGTLALAAGAFAATLVGALSRTLAASLCGGVLGLVLGLFAQHAIATLQAEREATAQAGLAEADRRLFEAVATEAGDDAIVAALRDSPVPVAQLVCLRVMQGPQDIDTLMRLGRRLVDAGDAAAPADQRQRVLLLILYELQARYRLEADLPAWLALWRANEPGAASVEVPSSPYAPTTDDCAAVGADTLREAFQDGGLPTLHAWREAGFAPTPAQQQALLAPLRSVADVEAALALGLEVDARGTGGLSGSDATALMEQAYGAGLGMAGHPDDPEDAESVDVVEALLRHGADPALRDRRGRDACALFAEALAGHGPDLPAPEGAQVKRARGLLCPAAAPTPAAG